MSIKRKIIAGFFGLLIPVYIINAYFLYQSTQNLNKAVYLKEKSLPNYILLGDLKSSVGEVTNWLTNVAATRSAKGYKQGYGNAEKSFKAAKSSLTKLIDNYKALNKKTTTLDKIAGQIDTFYEVGKEMAYAYKDGGTDAGNEMMNVFFQVSNEFQDTINELEKEIQTSHLETVDSMEAKLTATKVLIGVFSTVFAILSIIISILIANLIVRPIRGLIRVIKDIHHKKDLSLKVEVKGNDEMTQMSKEFNFMMDKLYANEKELTATRDALWGEMQLAKKIQTCLVPSSPAIDKCEVLGYMQTADEVGGDYYDVINSTFKEDGKDWLVIGDVSGHGVPAGLVMMMVQSLIHAIIKTGHYNTPAEVLTQVNKTLTQNIRLLSENKYMTITLLSLKKDGTLEYAGAHQDLLIYRKKKKVIEQIETPGFWIGIEDDIEPLLVNNKIKLDKGDLLFLFTDGVTEAILSHEMFEINGIRKVMEKHSEESLETVKSKLLEALSGYKQLDDITFMMVRRI